MLDMCYYLNKTYVPVVV